MKIEIAESLVFSWLRHVRGCAVTQMNWKPSLRWAVANEHVLREDFERIRALAEETVDVAVFKKCDFSQFVRQCEIDVLGMAVTHDPAASQVIAVDSAFHEGGLNYGSADETVGRVLKKVIRAWFAIDAYLNVGDATIVFATPKVAAPIQEAIERHLAMLDAAQRSRVDRAGPRMHFRLIANAAFAEEILQPVLDMAGEVADTSELFLRAQQLMALCERPARQRQSTRTPKTISDRGEGIGAHVRATMTALAGSDRLTPEIVSDLSSARYSKTKFKLAHSFLKPVDQSLGLSGQRHDSNGYSRYWKHTLSIGGNEFLVCNHWFDWQRAVFDQWARDLD